MTFDLLGSGVVYAGLVVAVAGLVLIVRPIGRLGVATRRRGAVVFGAGAALAGIGLSWPAGESRAVRVETHLDEFAPVWQFHEVHSLRIDAPPVQVFDAIARVRADEIRLFQTLTWIRRGGQSLPPGILAAGTRESLIDVALRGGFIRLSNDPPREVVIGALIMAPPGVHGRLTAEAFRRELPPGFVFAAMNFVVTPDGPGRSLVSTETRVFANSNAARRRFARYWRLIYPGSAIIRRMWLRAIERRATGGEARFVTAPALR